MRAASQSNTERQESFTEFATRIRSGVETALKNAVTQGTQGPNINTQKLHKAMAYSLLDGGKRLRPILVCAAYEAINKEQVPASVFDVAAAIECIHAYSLIHDDLPAMDDDDLRRGKPTNHIAFGEANAILAGDALHTLAFEILCATPLNADIKIDAIRTLSKASGAKGMIGGQFFDLASENQQLNEGSLAELHAHKTGALIAASLELGAIAAGATATERSALVAYGLKLGLAFQVVDDILDIESDTETLGKTQGADIAANKATYPALIGLEASKHYAHTLIDDALAHLDRANLDYPQLAAVAKFVTERRN